MGIDKQKPVGYKFSKKVSKQLNKLSKLDNYHGPLALLQDWIIILISIILTKFCVYLYPLCLIFIGSRQRALSTIFHDAAHGRAAKSRVLNLLIGTIFSGFWLFQSIFRYKDSHVKRHHGYLGNENVDPDFQFYIQNGLYDSRLKASKFLFGHVISTALLFKVPSYILYLLKNRIFVFNTYKGEFSLMLCFWAIIFSIAFYYKCIHLIILYWLLPFLTIHVIIGYFLEIAEHYPFLGTSNEIIYLSRNRFSHWLEALFFSIHNENYHLVHHLRPAIPFWNMVKAHHVMMQDKKYALINRQFGGIFISNNSNKSLLKIVINDWPQVQVYIRHFGSSS